MPSAQMVLSQVRLSVWPSPPFRIWPHERVGVWDRNGDFKTYFDETISSDALLFNDNNLIVITLAPGNNSYLVPKPGVRLNLADLGKTCLRGRTYVSFST